MPFNPFAPAPLVGGKYGKSSNTNTENDPSDR